MCAHDGNVPAGPDGVHRPRRRCADVDARGKVSPARRIVGSLGVLLVSGGCASAAAAPPTRAAPGAPPAAAASPDTGTVAKPDSAGAVVQPAVDSATALQEPPACRLASIALCIQAVLEQPPLDRTHWGVEVYDAHTDRALVRINADKHFIPASNEKLLTTSTAMALLGPDHRYTTEVRAPGFDRPSGVAGSLLVRGSGDPTFSKRFGPEELSVLDSLADSVYAAGVRRIIGPVIINVSRFDSTLINPDWEIGDLDWYYAAPIAAFGASEGAIPLLYGPGAAAGAAAKFEYQGPPGMVTVLNRVTTVGGDSARWDVKRLGADTLLLTGTISSSSPERTTWIAVQDPAQYAGRALLLALQRRGVEVGAGLRVVYDSAVVGTLLRAGPAPLLTTWKSPPLIAIVRGLLEPSQNWIAEQLLKTLGAEVGEGGSWDGGLDVVRRFLVERVGIDSLAFRIEDGSGLAAQDLVTPDMIVRLLTWDRLAPWGEQYLNALASPGEPESTLEHRLIAYRGRIFAKTGTISNVNSLSGFLITDEGRELVFSILSNGSGLPSSTIRDAMDRIVALVAAEGARP